VIHRDIKPANVLFEEGQAVVADFGIAKAVAATGQERLTQTGLSVGTPQYMSPEQATGEPTDARSDIYSLGAVLYEMLTGEPPYTGPTTHAIVAKLITERPIRPRVLRETVPERVDQAVMKTLARSPADRFATAGELADVLAGAAVAGPAASAPPARAVGHRRRPHARCRRNRVVGVGARSSRAHGYGPDRRTTDHAVPGHGRDREAAGVESRR
jgi:serine/threonine-protein kinase